MFNFNPFKNTERLTKPAGQNEDEKTEAKKSNLFKRVGVFASAAAMLLSVEAGPVLAGRKDTSPEKQGRDKIESVIRNNDKTEHAILHIAETKGRSGRMNQTPIKKLDLPDGSAIIVGYNDKGKAKWLMYENADGSITIINFNLADENGKGGGTADRIIFNNKKITNPNQEKAFNHSIAFSNDSFLATDARITASVKEDRPEDVQVHTLTTVDGERVIRSVDYKSGEATEIANKAEVENYDRRIQLLYGNKLNNAKSQIEQAK